MKYPLYTLKNYYLTQDEDVNYRYNGIFSDGTTFRNTVVFQPKLINPSVATLGKKRPLEAR